MRIKIFSGNALKILACILMVCDHVGYMLVPASSPFYLPLRIVGRLSFPTFAYLLAEGCRYTKDKFRHFSLLFTVAVVCQVVYYFFDNGDLSMSVLITFSLSELLIFALQQCKKRVCDKDEPAFFRILCVPFFSRLRRGGVFAVSGLYRRLRIFRRAIARVYLFARSLGYEGF